MTIKLGKPLTDRASQALVLIGRLGYLTQHQLSDFLFVGTSAKPASQPVLTRRVLTSLVVSKLAEVQPRLVGGPGGGSSVSYYRLTPTGRRLAQVFDETLTAPASTEGRISVRHSLAIADVLLLFHTSAITHPGHQLLSWNTEWTVANKLGRTPIVPDIHLVYATRKTELELVIEVDLGTERSRYFVGKIARYLDLLQSGTWRQAFEDWPIVLTVVPNEARAALLATATERYLTKRTDFARLAPVVEFAFASLPRLSACGPLDKVWHVAGKRGLHALETGVV